MPVSLKSHSVTEEWIFFATSPLLTQYELGGIVSFYDFISGSLCLGDHIFFIFYYIPHIFLLFLLDTRRIYFFATSPLLTQYELSFFIFLLHPTHLFTFFTGYNLCHRGIYFFATSPLLTQYELRGDHFLLHPTHLFTFFTGYNLCHRGIYFFATSPLLSITTQLSAHTFR